jgi:hypothetical protein
VVGHAISTDSILLAAEAGLDTIEHCSWIGEDPRTTVTDDVAVDHMVKNGVRVDHAIIPRPYLFPDEQAAEPNAEEQWWLSMLTVRWPYLHVMQERGVPIFLGTDRDTAPDSTGPRFPPGPREYSCFAQRCLPGPLPGCRSGSPQSSSLSVDPHSFFSGFHTLNAKI